MILLALAIKLQWYAEVFPKLKIHPINSDNSGNESQNTPYEKISNDVVLTWSQRKKYNERGYTESYHSKIWCKFINNQAVNIFQLTTPSLARTHFTYFLWQKTPFLTKICNQNFFSKTFLAKLLGGKATRLEVTMICYKNLNMRGKSCFVKKKRCASLLPVKSFLLCNAF